MLPLGGWASVPCDRHLADAVLQLSFGNCTVGVCVCVKEDTYGSSCGLLPCPRSRVLAFPDSLSIPQETMMKRKQRTLRVSGKLSCSIGIGSHSPKRGNSKISYSDRKRFCGRSLLAFLLEERTAVIIVGRHVSTPEPGQGTRYL